MNRKSPGKASTNGHYETIINDLEEIADRVLKTPQSIWEQLPQMTDDIAGEIGATDFSTSLSSRQLIHWRIIEIILREESDPDKVFRRELQRAKAEVEMAKRRLRDERFVRVVKHYRRAWGHIFRAIAHSEDWPGRIRT